MKRFFLDLYGSWILFFHYLKWPLVLGLPVLYLQLDYKRNIIMDILWLYCLYLIAEGLYKRFVLKQNCASKSCKTKKQ